MSTAPGSEPEETEMAAGGAMLGRSADEASADVADNDETAMINDATMTALERTI